MERGETYEFGSFHLEVAEQRLVRAGTAVHLTPKALAILIVLVRRSGHLVTSNELLGEVWPDTAVEAGSLTRNISTIRAALGRDDSGGDFIETVPRRGYRFVAPVNVEEPPTPSRTVAVLPFISYGGDGQAYFGVGLADALITRLGRVEQFVVRPTSSVLRFASEHRDACGAGRDLRVDWVVEGRVRKADQLVRVTLQVVRVSDGVAIWTDKVDQPMADLFGLEDLLAERVARALEVRLSDGDRHRRALGRAADVRTHLTCMRGHFHLLRLTQSDVVIAHECFRSAVESDPSHAVAWAGLASAYSIGESVGLLFGAANRAEAVELAWTAATRAVELDPALGEAHRARADLAFWYRHDRAAAADGFTKAIELEPRNPLAHHYYGWFLAATGRFADSARHLRIALDLDPLSPALNVDQGFPLFLARQYDDALARYSHALELEPSYPYVHLRMSEAFDAAGDGVRSLEAAERAVDALGSIAQPQMARALAACGRHRDARELLDVIARAAGDETPYSIAIGYAALGDLDQTFAWFGRARETNDKWLAWLGVDPRLDLVRADARVTRFLTNHEHPARLRTTPRLSAR
jgi:DNA-binding winged helix-turn-helix (wHTH) protein/Tfp pilus assembly protein PilF